MLEKIFKIERKESVCTSLDEFRQALTETDLTRFGRYQVYVHERAHFEKAKKLGYDAELVLAKIQLTIFGKLIEYNNSYSTRTISKNGQAVLPDHQLQISLAPKNPSQRDYQKAGRILAQISN